MEDLSTSKEIYGLGLLLRATFSSKLKKQIIRLLKKIERRLPFPFNKGLSYFCRNIRYKFVSVFEKNELKKIVDFLEKNLTPGKFFVLYSEGGNASYIAKQLKNTHIGQQLWAHYDANHRGFDAFNRVDPWVGIDHTYAPVEFNLFLVSPDRYNIAIRRWKFEYNSPWKVILPYYQQTALTLKEWENPTPTLLWVMQFAGAARLSPTFDALATYFQRTPLQYCGTHSFTARSIANLKFSSGSVDFCEVQQHMEQERHCYKTPEKHELTDLLYLITKRLPYGSWTSVHEFIDFSKLSAVQDLQSVILIRDPRDMIISAFFRCGYDPRNLSEGHPNAYLNSGLSVLLNKFDPDSFKQEALFCLAKGGTYGMCPTYYMNWPSIKELAQSFLFAQKNPNAFIIKFEDIRFKPRNTYSALLKWLNWNPRNPMTSDQLEKAIFYGTFDFQTKGQLKEGEQTDFTKFDSKTGHAISARKGISGDWKNHFGPKVKGYVKEQIGEELIQLGYEKDLNW